ncbi:MAG: hypothetical protein ACT4NU_10260, partial [Chromatiales bacterium]
SSLRECPLLDRFEEIDRLLFSAIVLDHLQREFQMDRFGQQPLPFLEVVPPEGAEMLPMMFSDPIVGANRSWNPMTFQKIDVQTKLAFIGFFDWNEYGYVSLAHYRVQIAHFPARPGYEGREALVETSRSRVILT